MAAVTWCDVCSKHESPYCPIHRRQLTEAPVDPPNIDPPVAAPDWQNPLAAFAARPLRASAVILGRTVQISGRLGLGRDRDFAPEVVDLLVPYPEVSRLHAELRLADGAAWLRNHQPMNGTSCDGRQVEAGAEVRLRDGAMIGLANLVWVRLAIEEG